MIDPHDVLADPISTTPDDDAAATGPAVQIAELTVVLGGETVLDRVSLTVARGSWLSIIGPNGAGKTTLLRALIGLVPTRGSVMLDGVAVGARSRRDRARAAAVVAQNPVVPPGMSVRDYVLLGRTPHLRPLGRDGAADVLAVRDALDQLDLVRFADRPLDTLSGGERQRAFMARALAQAAPILLLDEPTTSLDVGHQQEVLELVDGLRRTNGLTVVSTMHDLTLAGQYADRLLLLDRGRGVAAGTAVEVLTEHNLDRFYGARVRVLHGDDGTLVVAPVRAGRPRQVTP